MNNKSIIISFFLPLFIVLFGCTSIASLPQEPSHPSDATLKSLSAYEAKLASYALYLQTFLVRTKEKFGDANFPKFTLFDSTLLQATHTINAVTKNIEHLKYYINITKPIAIIVYKKYSKLKK
ncbi:hypothetical protein CR532_04775 (plasmid) [Candidatus Borreliella tachyglossi]|uniref:Outer surface protein n=1 Tax=Candidatus Borreliella tachyglossi TaxID=1964448 RepID=A0A2S1LYC5_9SPIR|nr:BBA14 family lipoprotein [Candidatus Borreliella tachyglossi]AWG43314.1 hypothetical protein CR532_04775 [Candidatus Borreliella tachyglossi]